MLRYGIKSVTHSHRGGNRVDLDCLGVIEYLLCQVPNLFRHGCREEQGLALCRQTFDDTTDVRQKTHIEHAVRFIKNQYVHFAQVNGTLLDMVEQASRAGDDDFNASLEFGYLWIHADTAIYGDAA